MFPATAAGDGEAQLRDDVNSNLEWHILKMQHAEICASVEPQAVCRRTSTDRPCLF